MQEQLGKIQSAVLPLQAEGMNAVSEEYNRLMSSLNLNDYVANLLAQVYEALLRQPQEILKTQVDITPAIEEPQKKIQACQPDSTATDSTH